MDCHSEWLHLFRRCGSIVLAAQKFKLTGWPFYPSIMTPAQPVPEVTEDDLERIVHRDFPVEELSSVMAILKEYGTEKWHREPTRVRLAALKRADGSMTRLQVCIESAKRDYRDVLAAAEYPTFHKMGWGRKLAADERRGIIDSDWQQYEAWLKR
jgi:hypothetical protein